MVTCELDAAGMAPLLRGGRAVPCVREKLEQCDCALSLSIDWWHAFLMAELLMTAEMMLSGPLLE